MAEIVGPITLKAAGSTGTGASNSYKLGGHEEGVAVQFVVEAVGATPTITFTVQGSLDGVNWYNTAYILGDANTTATAALTMTAVGIRAVFIDSPTKFWKYVRINVSANTNVTYRAELYAQNSAA